MSEKWCMRLDRDTVYIKRAGSGEDEEAQCAAMSAVEQRILREALDDANRGAMTREAARSITLTDHGDKSDCYYAWRQLQDAGAWVWDTNEMPENDPQRFEIMHAIQQAMGLLARRFTDKDLSLATEAREGA